MSNRSFRTLGTFNGVFVPSFEAILGAVLFLVLPMLVGAVGLWQMVVVILLANSATAATAFSIADTATNLRSIGAGGMYAVSKRSLGLAFGGSIGIQLYFAQAISIGFYCLGFAEPLVGLLARIPFLQHWAEQYLPDPLHQRQIVASVIAVAVFIMALVGTDFVSRIQLAIFVILCLSVGSILLSPLAGTDLFTDSPPVSRLPSSFGFWLVFATFFPAVTGIDAGVGMSGALRNPSRALPLGTFMAIGVTLAIYLAVSWIFSLVRPQLLLPIDGQSPTALSIFSGNPAIGFILLCGILVATGSSALSYFLTAPRTLQALVADRILPSFLSFLGRDLRRSGSEPGWATLFTVGVALIVIWSGDIGFASLVVGISFLMVYGWVNVAAFFERVSSNPHFRPTSVGHWSISLYGVLICLLGILLFSVGIGLLAILFQVVIFGLILHYRAGNRLEGVWWGLLFSIANWSHRQMGRIVGGTKNWRPIVGVFLFPDHQTEKGDTLRMVDRIAQYKGLTMISDLTEEEADGIIRTVSDSRLPGGLTINTVMLPFDHRINLSETIGRLTSAKKSVLLYRHGAVHADEPNRIDVWWKGEQNGNLMALLAYIINETDVEAGRPRKQIRLLRKLSDEESPDAAGEALQTLMVGARLGGTIEIVEADDSPFNETMRQKSGDASLILMGMPGREAGTLARTLSLENWLFTREFVDYEQLPPLLFVKAAGRVDLLE